MCGLRLHTSNHVDAFLPYQHATGHSQCTEIKVWGPGQGGVSAGTTHADGRHVVRLSRCFKTQPSAAVAVHTCTAEVDDTAEGEDVHGA